MHSVVPPLRQLGATDLAECLPIVLEDVKRELQPVQFSQVEECDVESWLGDATSQGLWLSMNTCWLNVTGSPCFSFMPS